MISEEGTLSRNRSVSAASIHIGCAGWSLASDTSEFFTDIGSHLRRYSGVFNAVEINSSFYRAHRHSTYLRWASEVPAHFRFSVKMPKAITHEARLQNCARPLRQFISEIDGLGDRLGCVLVQLPPTFAFVARAIQQFLKMVRRHFDKDVVIEARHITWFEPAVDVLLSKFDVGRAGSDPALCPAAAHPGSCAPISYLRLHGSPRMYYSKYDEPFLRRIAADLKVTSLSRPAWCIFDNTAHGFATWNALRMVELTRDASPTVKRKCSAGAMRAPPRAKTKSTGNPN